MKVKYEAEDKVTESLRENLATMTLEMSPRVEDSERSLGGYTFGLRGQLAC